MKKLYIALVLIIATTMSGCSTIKIVKDKVESKNSNNSIYCSNCEAESKAVTKFCSNCGEEAKWLAQKPDTVEAVEKVEKEEKEIEQYSYKSDYINKLDIIEEQMIDIEYLYENGVTSEMNEAELIRLKRWDDMLNEIYGLLKSQLNENEMEALKVKQRNWIKYRDKTADNDASEAGDGSLSTVVYNSSLAETTKKRCYELVSEYMK